MAIGGLNSSLGVDLVEIQKAKSFYKTHKHRLDSFFSPKEINFISGDDQSPIESLAMLLAAKEAVFKANNRGWMGPWGFKSIRMASKTKKNLIFESQTDLSSKNRLFQVSFIQDKEYVVAKCVGIC